MTTRTNELPPDTARLPAILTLDADTTKVDFTGILQESTNLKGWTDVDPQPASPFQFSPSAGNRFFRSRTD